MIALSPYEGATHAWVADWPCGCRGAGHVEAAKERLTEAEARDLLEEWDTRVHVHRVPMNEAVIRMCVHKPKWNKNYKPPVDQQSPLFAQEFVQ